MKIHSVKKEDRGTYFCVADNGIGKPARRNVAVEVEFPPTIEGGGLGTPFPINNLLALHKQYTNCPSNLAGYEAENLYKRLLFIRNIL